MCKSAFETLLGHLENFPQNFPKSYLLLLSLSRLHSREIYAFFFLLLKFKFNLFFYPQLSRLYLCIRQIHG